MQPPRIGVRTLMAVVAAAALNAVFWRAIVAHEYAVFTDATGWDELARIVPLSVAPQAALFIALRRKGPQREFWLGFLAAGTAVLLSFVWFVFDPPWTSLENPATGQVDGGVYTIGGCAVAPLWKAYIDILAVPLDSYINDPLADLMTSTSPVRWVWLRKMLDAILGEHVEIIPIAEVGLFNVILQLFVSWVGGVSTRAIARRWCRPVVSATG